MAGKKTNPQNVIESYKKRQKMMPFVIGGAAVLLVVAGIIILIASLGPNNPLAMLGATATFTPTSTFTATATVPSPTPTSTVTLTPTLAPTATPTLQVPFEYTVQQNDTCWDIALKYKVDLQVLLAINNFPAGTCPITPSQKIIVPAPGQTLPTATPVDLKKLAPNSIYEYTVQLGDTLRGIAIAFNSTQDAILKLNTAIKDANALLAGQKIKIPVNIVTPVPTLAPTSTPSTRTPVAPSATATRTP